ncbi:MAG: hypothetical protein D6805_08865, partial [Planctomycetota bacterium]
MGVGEMMGLGGATGCLGSFWALRGGKILNFLSNFWRYGTFFEKGSEKRVFGKSENLFVKKGFRTKSFGKGVFR